MGYHFVRGDVPHPIWDELRAVPYGMLFFLFLAMLLLVPPQESSLHDLPELEDSPELYSNYAGGYSAVATGAVECISVPLSEVERGMAYHHKRHMCIEKFRSYYNEKRKRWNTYEWSRFLDLAWSVNNLSDTTAVALNIPVLPMR